MNHTTPDGLIQALLDDVTSANRARTQSDSAYARRTTIRTMFAALEGFTAFSKWQALERARALPHLYSPAELSLLREETYTLSKGGVLSVQPRFLPTLENFSFAYRMCTRSTGAPNID